MDSSSCKKTTDLAKEEERAGVCLGSNLPSASEESATEVTQVSRSKHFVSFGLFLPRFETRILSPFPCSG